MSAGAGIAARHSAANLLRSSWAVVTEHWHAYVVLNVAYYGLVAVGMAIVFGRPDIQQDLVKGVSASLAPGGGLADVAAAYASGNVLAAAAVPFWFNLTAGALLYITAPSLVIPFAGVPLGFVRAVLWGLMLAPQGALALLMIPHSITLVLEGQGYIIAMLGAWTVGRGLILPAVYGKQGRLAGYAAGVGRCARLYVLVAIVLAVAALYEAVEVILMMRLGGGG